MSVSGKLNLRVFYIHNYNNIRETLKRTKLLDGKLTGDFSPYHIKQALNISM